jgi:CheY-like chemotaxis protein
MEGNIDVISEDGKGCNFFFTAKFNIENNKNRLINEIPSNFNNIRVLTLEDNKTSRNIIESYLDEFNTSNLVCTDTDFALELLEEGQVFDLIFIGCGIYGNDGIRTLRTINRIYTGKELPKIMLVTSCTSEEIYKKAIKLGCKDVLYKPINKTALINSVSKLFAANYTKVINHTNNNIYKNEYNLQYINLLLVEDNEVNQQIAYNLLDAEGVIVTIANNGQESLELLQNKSNNFDVILMDLHMPVLDGYKASRKIRTELKNHDIPIIALTADAIKETKDKILEYGMNDYMTKPISTKLLFEKIYKWTRTTKPNNQNIVKDKLNKVKFKEIDKEIEDLINMLNEGDSRARKVFQDISVYLKNYLAYEEMKNLTDTIADYNFTDASMLLKKIFKMGLGNNDR